MAKLVYHNKLILKYPQQKRLQFLKFNIIDFYPSITEKLLSAAISFAKSFTQIDDDAIQIIQHSRKLLLFNEKEAWIKNRDSLFDVTMGFFNGAKIYKLVGLFKTSYQISSPQKTSVYSMTMDSPSLEINLDLKWNEPEKT